VTAPARYVVDAAVVAKWAFPEGDSAAAAALLTARVRGQLELIAPDLLVAELAAICRRKARAGDVSLDRVGPIYALLLAALPDLVPTGDLGAYALELALRHDRPIAEALHLALALRESCCYVTADDRVLRILAPAFPCVRHLADVAL
jgi:predicted nucleic acid-binding protein